MPQYVAFGVSVLLETPFDVVESLACRSV